MKVCPVCGTSYAGKEAFCPRDGGRLEERSAPTGKLVGDILAETTKLERLDFVDSMGERYSGRFTDTKRAVYVTVFNQNFAPSKEARRLVETARAQVGNPLPPQLSAILRLNFENDPPFVVETSPAGPSIRALIQERQRLDWQTAVRIACNVARVMDWLAGHGVAHHGLHPGSVFVTDINKGDVQLGEWYSEDAQWVENPMQVLSQDSPPFVGYVAYMAPELAEKSSAADLRSAVYALGILLYEMIIGKPPFVDARDVEVLRQHIHEQPVRVSIARGGGEVHPDLDHILEMMLSKKPDARFQAPGAVIAALSNLLNQPPHEVAPSIERAAKQIDDDIFQTIEMSSVDRDSVPGLSSPKKADIVDSARKLGTAQNAAAKAASLDRGHVKGKAPSVVVEPELLEEAPKKTLMMSNIGAALEAEAARQSEIDAEPRSTLMMGSSPFAASEASEPSEVNLPKDPMDDSISDASDEVGLGAKSSMVEVVKPAKIKGRSESSDLATKEVVLTSEQEATLQMSAENAEQLRADAERLNQQVRAKDEAGEAEGGDVADKLGGSEAPDELESGDPTVVTKRSDIDRIEFSSTDTNPSIELHREDWFSDSHDDEHWEDSLAAHHHERSEQFNRYTKISLMVVLALAFVAALVYFEYFAGAGGSEPEPGAQTQVETKKVEPKRVEPKQVEPSEPDLSTLTAAFDTSLQAERLVAPPGNSALSALEALERDAPKSSEFQDRRSKFVAHMRTAAKRADTEGDLMAARSLADAGLRYAPEDAELKSMSADYQARFSGQHVDAGVQAGSDAGQGVAVALEPKPEPKIDSSPKRVTPEVKKNLHSEHKTQVKPEKSPGGTAKARDLAKQAKNAYHRNDIKKSQKLYERALSMDSSSHVIHAGLGQVYFDQAKYSKAVKHQGRAVKLKPGRVDYRISLGQSYYRLGRYAQAIKVWEAVLAKHPNNKKAQQYVKLAKRKLN